MTLPRPNATRDLFPSRSFFLQRGALARVGGFIRRFIGRRLAGPVKIAHYVGSAYLYLILTTSA